MVFVHATGFPGAKKGWSVTPVEIPFVKMHGNGNDFIVLENLDGYFSPKDLALLARETCRRKHSIGADGVLVVERSEKADFRMRLFNADGSEGAMCGNGARCISRYALERRLAPARCAIETGAGMVEAFVEPPFAEIDMGVVNPDSLRFDLEASVENRSFRLHFVHVGVPHAVLDTPDLEQWSEADLRRVGKALRSATKLFPEGANINFVKRISPYLLEAVTFERGVEDLTDSCGTGCVASALICRLRFDGASPVEVRNPGGVNVIRIEPEGTLLRLFLRGRTAVAFRGVLSFPTEKE